MPRQIATKEELEKFLPEAREIRLVKGKGDQVKLKLRTDEMLYTFKTTEEEAQTLIKGQKLEVIEY